MVISEYLLFCLVYNVLSMAWVASVMRRQWLRRKAVEPWTEWLLVALIACAVMCWLPPGIATIPAWALIAVAMCGMIKETRNAERRAVIEVAEAIEKHRVLVARIHTLIAENRGEA